MFFCTKTCDSIKNHIHHGKNQSYHEIEGGHIILNVLYSKSVKMLGLYLVLVRGYFYIYLIGRFNVNYSVNLIDNVSYVFSGYTSVT